MVRSVGLRIAFAAMISGAALGGLTPLPLAAVSASAAEIGRSAIEAVDLAYKGRFIEAGDAAARSGDPAAQKLVELLYLKEQWKDAGYQRIMDFTAAAPKWPLTETLAKNAERALYANGAPANVVLAHFSSRKTLTPEGALALARAQLETGNDGEARKNVARVWSNELLDGGMDSKVLGEFSALISADDHKRRMSNLIYAQESNAAIRASKKLSSDYQAAAKVAQLLLRGVGGADKKYASLSSAMRKQPSVQYALARYYRKLQKDEKARAILLNAPSSGLSEAAAEAWWVEKRILARKSIGPNRRDSWQAAYRLAKSHGNVSGEFQAEGEFLAGWIALRSLKDPQTALAHFRTLQGSVQSRTDKARANYWLGRTYEALGDDGSANGAYRKAAATPTVYYGQLAREKLGAAREPIGIASGAASDAAKAKVDDDEVMRALRMVAATGRKSELNMFLWSIASRFKTQDEMNAAAAVAQKLGGITYTLRLAKLAGQKGVDIDSYAYPTKALPPWATIGKPIERSIVFGLSRQESEFDPNAGSKVGAQGLMQLMPGTAKLVARQYRIGYAQSKLKGDPAYNVKLGAAHLADLVEDFGGSYVLTLAGYNAGPRRSREWIEAYGDPRSSTVDAIDWVESIPFAETRTYVQKVLQNTQVYRSRLDPKSMRAMTADLKRGSGQALAVAKAGDEAGTCSGGVASLGKLISECD